MLPCCCSWATQRITELTRDLDKALKRVKVRPVTCRAGVPSALGTQPCAEPWLVACLLHCMLQDLEKHTRTQQDNSKQLQELQALWAGVQQAAAAHEAASQEANRRLQALEATRAQEQQQVRPAAPRRQCPC